MKRIHRITRTILVAAFAITTALSAAGIPQLKAPAAIHAPPSALKATIPPKVPVVKVPVVHVPAVKVPNTPKIPVVKVPVIPRIASAPKVPVVKVPATPKIPAIATQIRIPQTPKVPQAAPRSRC